MSSTGCDRSFRLSQRTLSNRFAGKPLRAIRDSAVPRQDLARIGSCEDQKCSIIEFTRMIELAIQHQMS